MKNRENRPSLTVNVSREGRLVTRVCSLSAVCQPFIPSPGRMSVNSPTLLVEAEGGIAASHFYGSRKFRSQMLRESPQAVLESSDPRGLARGPNTRGARQSAPDANTSFAAASFISAESSTLQTDILFAILFLMKSLKGSRGRGDGPGSGDLADDKGGALQWDCQVSGGRWGDKSRVE